MKRLVLLLAVCIMFACKSETNENVVEKEEITIQEIAPISTEVMETAVIYEANIRQYSPEGTFDEFTKDIPQLKQLGVKIIWLMPVFPISETKRKATGGADSKFAADFPKEEQAKYLGSYYAVSDFTKINPEFGTIEDFRELLKAAHDNGIYVILDWVPNHTGWDHEWLKTNPEYYTQNDNGEVIHPEGTDWTDVADLNYDNKDMRKEMIEDMSYWITEEGVDGFRCDVAGSVPADFWEEAIPKLRDKKDIFMLAEAWEPELLKGNLFDMAYAWDGHHLFNAIAKEEKTYEAWDKYELKRALDYEKDDILMNFVTNHDENSWNGAIKERMGEASELFTVFSYIIPGMPLIYSGQEYDLGHRLKFFEKDSIPKTKGETWNLLKKLGALKNTYPALNGGKDKASMMAFETDNANVIKYTRTKGGKKLTFFGNFSGKTQTFKMMNADGMTDYMTGDVFKLNNSETTLGAWKFKILINNEEDNSL